MMLLTPHTAAGVAIASVLPQPELAIPLSFLSHFVLDFIPHWDKIGLGMREKEPRPIAFGSTQSEMIALDVFLSLTYGLFFANWVMPDYGWSATILLSAFAANLPDMFYIPRVFFGKKWGWTEWMIELQHWVQQRSTVISPLLGLSTQVATIAICLLVSLR